MLDMVDTTLTVNGREVTRSIEPRTHLIDFLREDLGLTGSHVGCEHGVCGACAIRVDGEVVRGCLQLAVRCAGKTIETIESLSVTDDLVALLQRTFVERNALQCGFCTPGMLVTAAELIVQNPQPTRAEIRHHIGANYCRCTGYHAIVDAVESAARQYRAALV